MPTLVIQTAFLGDVVLTTPLLSALAAHHGPVDVVTTPVAAPLLETQPAVRQVIPYDKRGSDRGWGPSGTSGPTCPIARCAPLPWRCSPGFRRESGFRVGGPSSIQRPVPS